MRSDAEVIEVNEEQYSRGERIRRWLIRAEEYYLAIKRNGHQPTLQYG
jgi:hypothetical protein